MPEGKNFATQVLVVSAVATGVGFGLCSLGAVSGLRWLGFAVWLGAGMFFLGLAVLVVTGLVMLVQAFMKTGK